MQQLYYVQASPVHGPSVNIRDVFFLCIYHVMLLFLRVRVNEIQPFVSGTRHASRGERTRSMGFIPTPEMFL